MEEDKKLDSFIRKSIKELGLEKPSLQFTDVVLSKIQGNTSVSPTFVYKPLFSKSTWLIILTVVATIFVYLILDQSEIKTTWFSIAKLNQLASFNLFGKMPSLPISNTFVYGFLIFSFFAIVQVFMIKQRFNKHSGLL